MNWKKKLFCSLVFGLLLIAGAAFAGTVLPEFYTFDSDLTEGEHIDGEALSTLEFPCCPEPEPDPDPDIRVRSITVSPTSLALDVGESATVTATITPENATDKTVNWSFVREGRVTLNPTGLTCTVTGLWDGRTRLVAETRDGGLRATCNVTVGTGGNDPDPEDPDDHSPGGGGGGCSVGGTAVPLALLLAAPLALLLRRK